MGVRCVFGAWLGTARRTRAMEWKDGRGPVKEGPKRCVDDALVELGNLWAGEADVTVGFLQGIRARDALLPECGNEADP